MMIARSQYKPLTKVIFYSPEICGNIKTTKTAVLKKLRYMRLKFLVRYSGVWLPLYCIGNLLHWFHRRQGSWNMY